MTEAQAGFWDADYAYMSNLGLGIPGPWASATNGLGGATSAAWQSVQSDYTSLAGDINDANSTYQNTLTGEYQTLANSMRLANLTLATSLAGAEFTQATTFANLEAQLFTDMADLSNTYLTNHEAAAHTNRVADATVQRHYFVGIDRQRQRFRPDRVGRGAFRGSDCLFARTTSDRANL